MDLIMKVLSGRTKDELVEFLLDIASEYEEIKRRIELNFNIGDDEDGHSISSFDSRKSKNLAKKEKQQNILLSKHINI
jgi:hypothetical protein